MFVAQNSPTALVINTGVNGPSTKRGNAIKPSWSIGMKIRATTPSGQWAGDPSLPLHTSPQ